MNRRLLSEARFIESVDGLLADGCAGIPLLVFRVPEFAERAWTDGKRHAQRLERATAIAFTNAAVRVVREPDVLAHQPQSDWFCVAMIAPSRADAPFVSLDARAALERIAATMTTETGRAMEYGWWHIDKPLEHGARLMQIRQCALDRGRHERERYDFLATVGHELRTPLTSIRGYVETLLDDGCDAATARRFLEITRREALRLTRLVDGILNFSLLDLQARGGPCDVSQVAHAAIDALAPIAAEAGVVLVHPAKLAAHARIDPDGCTHVLLNLIENGIKYASRPGSVVVSIECADPRLSLIVEDDGLGVADSDRERIFAYGERAGASSTIPGRGVGLAIVRTIVERAGGQVRVERSRLGGARFCIDLAATKAEAVSLS